jgi:hypothetical protein
MMTRGKGIQRAASVCVPLWIVSLVRPVFLIFLLCCDYHSLDIVRVGSQIARFFILSFYFLIFSEAFSPIILCRFQQANNGPNIAMSLEAP